MTLWSEGPTLEVRSNPEGRVALRGFCDSRRAGSYAWFRIAKNHACLLHEVIANNELLKVRIPRNNNGYLGDTPSPTDSDVSDCFVGLNLVPRSALEACPFSCEPQSQVLCHTCRNQCSICSCVKKGFCDRATDFTTDVHLPSYACHLLSAPFSQSGGERARFFSSSKSQSCLLYRGRPLL